MSRTHARDGTPFVKMIHPNPPGNQPSSIMVLGTPEILREHKKLGWIADPEEEGIAHYKAVQAKIKEAEAREPATTLPKFTPVAEEKRETMSNLSKPKFNK